MLSIGIFVQHWFLIILGVVVAMVGGIWRWGRSEHGAESLDRFSMGLPIVGGIWLKYQVAMFSRIAVFGMHPQAAVSAPR